MDLLSTGRLQRITDHQRGPCVSLYHSLAAEDESTQRGSLVQRAAVELLETFSTRGNRRAAPLVASLERLSREAQCSAPAVAVFCAPSFEASFALPMPVEEAVHVADHFDVQPILTLWQDPTRFYLLVIEDDQAWIGLGTSTGVGLSLIPLHQPRGVERTLAKIDRRVARMLKQEGTPLVIVSAAAVPPRLDRLRRLELVTELPRELADLSLDELHRRAFDAAKTLLGGAYPDGEQEERMETR